MSLATEKMPVKARFDHLMSLIKSKRFLQKEGLGNEVPFFICSYHPEEAVEMDRMQKQLIKNLEQNGIKILEVNLYDLSVSLLKKRGIWEQILTKETGITKDELLELLHNVLDPQAHLIPEIVQQMKRTIFDVMFITGVGEVFPYIRSHNVLNNLQSHAKEKPTVIFFPGTYSHSPEKGASLDLFGRLHDDKYYRAFDIFHCEI